MAFFSGFLFDWHLLKQKRRGNKTAKLDSKFPFLTVCPQLLRERRRCD
jgi:hypothetical protein